MISDANSPKLLTKESFYASASPKVHIVADKRSFLEEANYVAAASDEWFAVAANVPPDVEAHPGE